MSEESVAAPATSAPTPLLRKLVGRWSWDPPAWPGALWTRVRAQPTVFGSGLLLVAALGWGGYYLAHRPKVVDPQALDVRASAPAATVYSDTPATVAALDLLFSGSVAPIERLGQPAVGIALEPALPGAWTWISDTQAQFRPANDWPVAQHYRIRIDIAQALAPKIKLTDAVLEFDTAPFAATISASEFYQDPQDPKRKLGAYEISFTHPVEVATFERLLRLNLVDGANVAQQAPQVGVSYDERKLKAFVRSLPLQVPENGGQLTLTMGAGARSALGGPGTPEEASATVALPSLYSVAVRSITPTLVDNDRFEPEQVLVAEFNDSLKDQEVAAAMHAWLLPESNPKLKPEEQTTPYGWSLAEIDERLLAGSTPIALEAKPAEREYVELHSFRYAAPAGRSIYVRVDRGLRSFGGFLLGKPHADVLQVPAYPELLRFVGEGALLSLRGERRVTVAARNVPGLRLEVARVLPDQLQHLVKYNSGSFAAPGLYSISGDSLTERFEKTLALDNQDPTRTRYEGIDLGEFFRGDRHGVFMLSLYRDDPAARAAAQAQAAATAAAASGLSGPPSAPEADYDGEYSEDEGGADGGSLVDSRLVVLSDLGVVVKHALDDSRSVFVQSLRDGTPVAGATVVAIARNGEKLVSADTDAEGRASLPALSGFKREKEPVLLAVGREGDLSFLPLDDSARRLDFSRFDVGGEVNAASSGALKAYLFSDRGLYRPGEEIHLGIIVRAAQWDRALVGVPLELDLTDPRGTLARRERILLDATGFEGFDHRTADTAATGSWDATLYLIGDAQQRIALGSTTVQVRDFLPDRLRVQLGMNRQSAQGWVSPEALSAEVKVENLFGTPAQDRRVSASVLLQPVFPSFARYPDFQFYDPQRAKEGYAEQLSDLQTDQFGHASFALDLSQYDRASYQLRFLAEAFEAGGGRGVAAETSVLVSSNPYLIGLKSTDPLAYVQRGAQRKVELLALGPDGEPTAVDALRVVIVEKRYVSVLTRQESGLFKYISQLRRDDRSSAPLALPAGRGSFALPTEQPGEFELELRDAADVVLNRIAYSVAGAANVARALDRNAELQLTLSKPDYRPGEEIEISVRAPYIGSGLITIERDRVFAHRWFRSDTTSSVQTIRVPADFEGNGYVNVQFVRDPDSSEIFMSPLSYGVAPFMVDRSARRHALTLDSPALVKPGSTARFSLHSTEPARVAVFAVDEGILQVARYRLGDPLDHFLRKRMLQVDTAQILDLILPEFSRLAGMAAPGGDDDGALARRLNPFKRKGERPAVYWSGVVEIDGSRDFDFAVPDSFNGKLRVMAVAVSAQRVGIAQRDTLVRGDFVISPNVPTQVSPGDEFEISAGIANAIEGGDSTPLPIKLTLQLPAGLSVVGPDNQSVSIATGNEDSVRFRLRAGEQLGSIPIQFKASGGAYSAQRAVEVSVRPNLGYRQDVRVGNTAKALRVDGLRDMYEPFATRRAAASISPLVLVDGLGAYLDNYPHYCTEQLLSRAIPGLIHIAHPEFAALGDVPGARAQAALAVLRERQNSSGGFGLWVAGPDADPFVSVYAALYLVEARERGLQVPDDLLAATNGYLTTIAADPAGNDLPTLRARALAIYLLTRQGQVTTPLIAALHEQLDRDQPKQWRIDAAAMLLASSYQLLKQDRAARELVVQPLARLREERKPTQWQRYASYYDETIASAWTVLLLSRHFPAQRTQIDGATLQRFIAPIRAGQFNTLSSALTVLALDAWAGTAPGSIALPQLAEVLDGGKTSPFGSVRGLLRSGAFSAQARALLVEPATDTLAWFSITQSGFDRKPPPAMQGRGLELVRDYLDAQDRVVTSVVLGAELTVRLRLRALDAQAHGDIAVVDLLPGGFELAPAMEPNSGDSGQPAGDGTQPAAPPSLLLGGTTIAAQHVDAREDRLLIYASAGATVTEARYRIKATNIGTFVVPPAFAESMYERDIYAQGGPAGTLTVGPAGD